MTSSHAGVDDSRSRYYNRIVDSAKVKRDWSSAENMVPKSGVYRRGVVVRHNWDQKPNGGSCIYLHIWSGRLAPTAGCTAMSEKNLRKILGWLDSRRHPLLVQLPATGWRSFGAAWGLPAAQATFIAGKTTKNAQNAR